MGQEQKKGVKGEGEREGEEEGKVSPFFPLYPFFSTLALTFVQYLSWKHLLQATVDLISSLEAKIILQSCFLSPGIHFSFIEKKN